jgi:hypothetical protein
MNIDIISKISMERFKNYLINYYATNQTEIWNRCNA